MHEYAAGGTGLFLAGFHDGAAMPCAWRDLGETPADGHSETSHGGAWILSHSGYRTGSVWCHGEEPHHPWYGPFRVEDAAQPSGVYFLVSADTESRVSTDPATQIECGDYDHDVAQLCVDVCTVTFPPGLDGAYLVFLGAYQGTKALPEGALHPGTTGHVVVG